MTVSRSIHVRSPILINVRYTCTSQPMYKDGLLRVVFFFFFLPHRVTCGILVPQPGIEPTPPAVEEWSLNRWTATEIPMGWIFVVTLTCVRLTPVNSTLWNCTVMKTQEEVCTSPYLAPWLHYSLLPPGLLGTESTLSSDKCKPLAWEIFLSLCAWGLTYTFPRKGNKGKKR